MVVKKKKVVKVKVVKDKKRPTLWGILYYDDDCGAWLIGRRLHAFRSSIERVCAASDIIIEIPGEK